MSELRKRKVLMWSHSLPTDLLLALNAQGIEIVALVQGKHAQVPSFSLHDLFAGGAPLAHFAPQVAPAVWLDDACYRSYARCIPRLGFYPGSNSYDTVGGIVDAIDLEDWARLHLNHALQLLDGVGAEEVWFTCPPHLGVDQMMARAAQCSGRKLLVFRQLRVAQKFTFRAYVGTEERTVASFASQPWRGGAVDPDLFYMEPAPPRHLVKTIPGLLRFAFRALLRANQTGWIRYLYPGARNRSFWALMGLLELGDAKTRPYAWSRWISQHRAARAARGHALLLERDLPAQFVYFPLHLEPEMTTAILGRAFANQLDALVALHSILPSGWQLVLKENPKQSYLHRGIPYWQRLNALPLVHFASPDIPSDVLVAKARIVATIIGTAGYESLLIGKPCVYFGDAWYEGLPGATLYSPSLDLIALAAQHVERAALDAACSAILSPLADGLVYPGYIHKHKYGKILAEQTAQSLSAISAALSATEPKVSIGAFLRLTEESSLSPPVIFENAK